MEALAILVILALLSVPVWILILLYMILHRQRNQELSLWSLERQLSRLQEEVGAASKPGAEGETGTEPKAPTRAEARKTIPVPPPPAIIATVPGRSESEGHSPHVAAPVAEPARERQVPPPITPSLPPPIAQSAPAPAPRERSTMETAARAALVKIWNWIIVGADHRPENVTMEYAVATNWLLRIGILIVVVGIGFFLRYSFEHNLINPPGRVAIGILSGLAMVGGGVHLLGRRYHLFGQGLIGGGLAALYFSIFAAAVFYQLISPMAAFPLMLAVTVAAGALATRTNSPLIAVLGILGGYGTPLMLATGQANFVPVLGYLVLLSLGILGIAHVRNWLLLNQLGMVLTYGVMFRELAGFYQVRHFWQVMPFLGTFFLIYSATTVIYGVLNRKKSTLLEIFGLLANAGVFFGLTHGLIADAHGSEWTALVSILLAALYVVLVLAFLRRGLHDRALLLTLTGLAAFFVTITIPLLLSREWITVSWAVQAFIMLWIASKLDSRFIRHVAYLLYVLVLARLCLLDFGQQFDVRIPPEGLSWLAYLRELLPRVIVFGTPIASLAGAFWLHRRPVERGDLTVGPDNDTRTWIPETAAGKCLFWSALALLFLYLHIEVNRACLCLFQPLRHPALTMLWVATCAFLIHELVQTESRCARALLLAFVAGLVFKLFVFDLPHWQVSMMRLHYSGAYSFLDGTMRLLNFGVMIALFAGAWHVLRPNPSWKSDPANFGLAAIALLFLYTTLELNTLLRHFVPGFRSGAVSILWSIFALSFVAAGILHNLRRFRYAGLALFCVVVAKVFFSDLAVLEPLYRIVAFVVLGLVVLSGSLVYLKFREHFVADAAASAEDHGAGPSLEE